MSESKFLLDTGPLVAFLNPREEHHLWAVDIFQRLNSLFITCESVLTEAFHLLARSPHGAVRLSDFCRSGIVQIDFRLLDNMKSVDELIRKYRDVPMSLADACLVQLADQNRGAAVITTDRDFLVYRTKSRRHIPVISPFSTGNN